MEPPQGELSRMREPQRSNEDDGSTVSAYYGALNSGKQSIALDLKNRDGMATFRSLLKNADVLVTNMRTGALERLGMHPDTLHKDFPRLIVASISGFGLKNAGAFADRAGLAMVAEALSGTTGLTRDHSGNPVWCGFALGDILAGMTAHAAVLLALRNQEKHGYGQVLDLALAECSLPMVCVALSRIQFSDLTQNPASKNDFHGVPYGAFPASDGFVNIGVNSDVFWRRFCMAMEKPELASDVRYATYVERAKRQEEVTGITEAFTRKHTREEINKKLWEADVPVASILSMEEVLTSEYFKERGALREVDDGIGGRILLPVDPTRFDDESKISRVPRLGEHRNEVLGTKLGFSLETIQALESHGAFGPRRQNVSSAPPSPESHSIKD